MYKISKAYIWAVDIWRAIILFDGDLFAHVYGESEAEANERAAMIVAALEDSGR